MDSAAKVPLILRKIFVAHFVVDFIFAIPLFFVPEIFLSKLGWQMIDPLAARLVAAALFAIGIESFLGRHASVETFRGMLNLKIIWSATAIAAFLISIFLEKNNSTAVWILLAIFLVFNFLWIFWRIRLKNLGGHDRS